MFQEQFVDTLTSAASAATPAMQDQAATMVQELSVWDLTMRGGFIMIPLAILSVISIYICGAVHSHKPCAQGGLLLYGAHQRLHKGR